MASDSLASRLLTVWGERRRDRRVGTRERWEGGPLWGWSNVAEAGFTGSRLQDWSGWISRHHPAPSAKVADSIPRSAASDDLRPGHTFFRLASRSRGMVADGVHILLAIALVYVCFRTTEAGPYLVAALVASVPDVDLFVFQPLIEMGYVEGIVWGHRGVTHSVFAGVLVVALAAAVGPWRPAAIGFGSHVAFDLVTGGVRLFAPLSSEMVGASAGWLLFNLLGSLVAGAVLVAAIVRMDPEPTTVVLADSFPTGNSDRRE